MRPFLYIFFSLMWLLLSSCGDPNEKHFGIDAKPIDGYLDNAIIKDRPHLKIKTSAFDRDFLLYGTFIPMLNSPTGHSLKGRVVKFQVVADRVIMLESPVGHSIAKDKSSLILLTEFPIVQAEADGVVIDFARGMNNVFTMRNVHSTSATAERGAGTAEQFRAISLSASFISTITPVDDVLSISQIAQWRNQKSELISAEFRYFFREYLPSPTFKKRTFGKHRWVQYFSTPPMVEPPTTEPIAYLTKWDIQKPIIFYVSSNTPPEYRQAIKDGLLFWNHVFQKNVVEVRDLDENLSAPHPSMNIIQWVTWDNEASAYADMVVDHLTGQIIQAQIYVRSGWVVLAAKKLRSQLQELLLTEPTGETITSVDEDVPMPAMFDLENPCTKSMTTYDELADLAHSMTIEDISPDVMTHLASDILRAVVAHELGHVLGLRHNLAGSTMGTMSLAERDAALRAYLRTGHYNENNDKFLTRSIMDVLSAADDALAGAQIRQLSASEDLRSSKLRTIYDHDRQAIEFGYLNKPMAGNMAFCTDEDLNRYLDCRRWDVSDTGLLFIASRVNTIMNQVSIVLAETFAEAVNPKRKGGPLAIRDIPLTNGGALKVLDLSFKELMLWFSKKTRSALLEVGLPAFGPQNEAQVLAAKFKAIRDQVAQRGVEPTLFGLLPPFRQENVSTATVVNNFHNQFIRQLNELQEKQKDFSISNDEIQEAVQIARDFIEQLNTEIITLLVSIIARSQFDDPEFQLPVEVAIGKIAEQIILSQKTASEPNVGTLPQFFYPLKARDAAAQMLNPAIGLLPDWSYESTRKISNDLKILMRRHSMQEGASTIDLNAMARADRAWLLEQNRILSTIMRVRSLVRPLTPPEQPPPATPPAAK